MSILPHITIQSASRANQVPIMLEALKPFTPTWYVPASQAQEYEDAGAKIRSVEGTMPMKTKQLNAALDDGFAEGRMVVTMDDDFRKATSRDWDVEGFVVVEVPLTYVLKDLVTTLEGSNKMLALNGHIQNMRWSRPNPAKWGMGSGGMVAHKPSPLRYDEKMNDTEDLDYVIQHHLIYGGLVKMMKYYCEFHFYCPSFPGQKEKAYSKNYEGGYKGYRTDESSKATARYLNKKYPFLRFEEVGQNVNMFKNIRWRDFSRED